MVLMLVTRMGTVVMFVAVRVRFQIEFAGHNENTAADPNDFYFGPVQPRERRPGNHFVHRSNNGSGTAKIQNAVNRIQQRIELMGAENDGDFELPLASPHDFVDLLLVSRIEADERFIEQKKPRLSKLMLGSEDALTLSAGHFIERSIGEFPRVDDLERPVDLRPL
jgi:hypothetical protein